MWLELSECGTSRGREARLCESMESQQGLGAKGRRTCAVKGSLWLLGGEQTLED